MAVIQVVGLRPIGRVPFRTVDALPQLKVARQGNHDGTPRADPILARAPGSGQICSPKNATPFGVSLRRPLP